MLQAFTVTSGFQGSTATTRGRSGFYSHKWSPQLYSHNKLGSVFQPQVAFTALQPQQVLFKGFTAKNSLHDFTATTSCFQAFAVTTGFPGFTTITRRVQAFTARSDHSRTYSHIKPCSCLYSNRWSSGIYSHKSGFHSCTAGGVQEPKVPSSRCLQDCMIESAIRIEVMGRPLSGPHIRASLPHISPI